MAKKNKQQQRFAYIMNFSKEEKIYKEYYLNKNEKYHFYSDWKKRIQSKLNRIRNVKEYDDFYRYCLNKKRSSKEVPQSFMAIMGIFLPIYFGLFIDDRDTFIGEIAFAISLAVLVGYILYIFLKDTTTHYFYEDLCEIVLDSREVIVSEIEERINEEEKQEKITKQRIAVKNK